MAKTPKKLTAKMIRELNLYADRSKEENTLRGVAWIVSWLIGIVAQKVTDPQALGGAYFIFSLSLLLEFVPERKNHPVAQGIYGVFNSFLVIMLLGSVLLLFESVSTDGNTASLIYLIVSTALFTVSCLTVIWILIGTLLALTETHKFFYAEEMEAHGNTEDSSSELRKQFVSNLQMPPSYHPEASTEVPTSSLAEATLRTTPEGENSQ